MKILLFTDNFPPETNAAAARMFERACYWAQWGHQVTVITSVPNFPQGKVYPGYRNRWFQTEQVDGIRVLRVKTFITANEGFWLRILDFLSYMFMAFVVGLFQEKPDVIAATSPQFFAAVAGWASSIIHRVPFVFELGDLWPKQIIDVGAMKPGLILRLLEKFELFLYARSSAIVALTPAFRDDLVGRGVPPDKISVVVNGVDLPRHRPMPRSRKLADQLSLDGHFVVGYIGTHGMSQALDNVLDAAELLRDHSDVRFLLVGNGAERQHLIAEAERRRLPNVCFVPGQTRAAVQEYWSLCDVALVHLRNAPVFATVIPSKMFEAMAVGLPLLLVAPPGPAKDIVQQEGAGVWVPPADPASFAAAVLRLKQDAALRTKLASGSLASAPRYSRERQARHMLSVLASVTRSGRSPDSTAP
jgi:colanic acid biosynthesis glycosyl transferase WcaI